MHYLCTEILNYPDVFKELHGPITKMLQQFPRPNDQQLFENDRWTGSGFKYTPINPIQSLSGGRRRLILDPRGHLKTTVNAQAHTIQWILNYPDVSIAIWQSNSEKAELILKEIKHHFQFNEKFRALFPELVPQKRPQDFGTKSEFTTPGRSPLVSRRESTVMTLSIEKGTAGLHFDVMKFSDIVEPENVKTAERIQAVKSAFYMAENLLVSPSYWIDVEGTIYTFDDLYYDLIDQWKKEDIDAKVPEYLIHVRGCYKKAFPAGQDETFTPNTINLPHLKNERGYEIPIFPYDHAGLERFNYEKLERMRAKDPYTFSCQQLNNPQGGADGKIIFPVNENFPLRIRSDKFRQNVRIASRTLSVDTAETANARSNYSALVVGAWDGYGRCWIEHITREKFLPLDLIQAIVAAVLKYKPSEVKIEETAFVRGLEVGLRREMDLKSIFIPLEFVKRDNQITKNERIQSTLQPYYTQGLIRFVDPVDGDKSGWAAFHALLEELRTFPKGRTDDILDATADLFQGKEWFGREFARPTPEQASETAWRKYLQIEDPFEEDSQLNYL